MGKLVCNTSRTRIVKQALENKYVDHSFEMNGTKGTVHKVNASCLKEMQVFAEGVWIGFISFQNSSDEEKNNA